MNNQKKQKQKKIFLTFGSKNYYQQVVRLSIEARNTNYFDNVVSFTDQDLMKDNNFWGQHGDFFKNENNCRGFGFWFWKPYIIKVTLDKMKENDILIYMDSGCMLNVMGKNRIDEYIEMLNENEQNYGILSFQLEHLPEIKYTKRLLITYLGASKDDVRSGQCMATVIIIKKNYHSVNLVNEWYRIASIRNMINDEKGPEREYNLFIDHRHDQSIYSLLVKKYGSIKIPDETYFAPDWHIYGTKYPFWATRIRN